MTRPLLLDVYCGAGGAGMGYHAAGFEVVGVDIEPQPSYPFKCLRADAIDYLEHMASRKVLPYHMIHASPPCQHYTNLARGSNDNHDEHPDLVAETRNLLRAIGLPAVIENVPTAPLFGAIRLCGEMFGLSVIRHRLFETSTRIREPLHHSHREGVNGWRHGVITTGGAYVQVYGRGGYKGTLEEWQQAMGIDWMESKHELAEAVPPAYTKYVGRQMLSRAWS